MTMAKFIVLAVMLIICVGAAIDYICHYVKVTRNGEDWFINQINKSSRR